MVIYNQMSEQFPNYKPEQWRDSTPDDASKVKSSRVRVRPMLDRHKKRNAVKSDDLSEWSQALIKAVRSK
jgi:hypothetical protein